MIIGIIGAGRVGAALGRAWLASGHDIVFGVRDPSSEKTRRLVADCGPNVRALTVAESATTAEVILIALPWSETEGAIQAMGDLRGKIVIDATNPIVLGADEATRGLLLGHTTSAGEQVAQWATGARVVKAFNTTGSGNMSNPNYGDRRAAMFVCGDDAAAKEVVCKLAREVGLAPQDVGALKTARLLEPVAMLWIQLAFLQGWGPDFAFDVLKR